MISGIIEILENIYKVLRKYKNIKILIEVYHSLL